MNYFERKYEEGKRQAWVTLRLAISRCLQSRITLEEIKEYVDGQVALKDEKKLEDGYYSEDDDTVSELEEVNE